MSKTEPTTSAPTDTTEQRARQLAEQLRSVEFSTAEGYDVTKATAVIAAALIAERQKAIPEGAICVAKIEHRPSEYARIVRVTDVSQLPHGTKLYALEATPPPPATE